MEGARDLSEVSFIMALIPFMRVLSHDLITSQRPPPPDTIALGIRISTRKFGADINIQSIADTE